jgi:ankyrin repeat protein
MIGSRRQTVVELDIQDVNGRTPVITCLRKGLVDILRLLLEAGADPNIQDDYLQSSLHYACAKPKPSLMWQTVEMIKLLLKYGADINLADAKFVLR